MAIGYDSRIKSDVFAKVAAGVFAANGVKVNIWPVLMPVPTVSFATRYLHTSAGVMVTASHNPSKYNGYKVYAAHHAGVPGRYQGVRRQKVVKLLDYAPGLDGLPKSDVLKFLLEDNCSIVVRPSGTEPKLKTYISISAENKETAEKSKQRSAKVQKNI